MGVERGGEEHEAAIERVKKAAQANGKTAAMFCELLGPKNLNRKTDLCLSGTNGEQAKSRAEQGFTMISVIADVNVIGDGIAREMTAAKGDDGKDESRSRVY